MITNHSWSLDSTPNESLAFEPSVPGQPSDPCLVHAAPRRLPIFHLLRESWNLTIPRPFRRPYSVTRTRCPSQSRAHSFTLVHPYTLFHAIFAVPWTRPLATLGVTSRLFQDHHRFFQVISGSPSTFFQTLSAYFRLFQAISASRKFFFSRPDGIPSVRNSAFGIRTYLPNSLI